jgi:hypothetical protein
MGPRHTLTESSDVATRSDASVPHRTILAISQVFLPDPASVGQHMADATAELARRGHAVTVLTSNRGYDDPSVRFARRESLQGVDIRRLPFSSFGKRSILVRLVGGLLFLLQAIVRGLFLPGVDTILVSTTPPMAGMAGVILATLRRARLVYWVMDLNPDQAVALGVVKPGSRSVRVYDWMNRVILGRADAVVALDRLMAGRLSGKRAMNGRLHILPPWPHEDQIRPVPRQGNPFRAEHRLNDRFVVMYSGNHSPANPLRTVIDAALELQAESDITFAFVGGGAGKREVEDAGASNILSLPYQPMETLHYSLTAADVHVVTMGDDMAGIIHPCKVYGAMAAARPILFVGPAECHVTDLMKQGNIGWYVSHGDVPGAVAAIRSAARTQSAVLESMGDRARALIQHQLSKRILCAAFCDIVDATVSPVRPPALGQAGVNAL